MLVLALAAIAMSLPVWGEWIEMLPLYVPVCPGRSLPVWGEWIEIFFLRCQRLVVLLVSPRVGRVD